jgi:hypothetical protein
MKKAALFLWAFVGLVWLIISLPFTDYSLTSLLDIPDSPPRSHDGLWKLLQNIAYAGNFSILSMLVLYGLNREWYLGDGYPNFLRRWDLKSRFTKAFENKLVFVSTNVVLTLLSVIFAIFFFLHGRILGRGLGYW